MIYTIVGIWSLHVIWNDGRPAFGGREWTILQGVDRHTCEQVKLTVTGPIARIWCQES